MIPHRHARPFSASRSSVLAFFAAAALFVAACGGSTGETNTEASANTGNETEVTTETSADETVGDDTTETTTEAAVSTPIVVATTSIWADVVSNVACGGLAQVETVIPIGGDPHSYEPSLNDRATMESAGLVVANGLLLEETIEDTIDAVEQSGVPVFRMAENVDTLEFGQAGKHGDEHDEHGDEHSDEHSDEHGDEHNHGSEDPHVWFDPIRVSEALPELADVLVSEAGLDPDAVDDCMAAYQDELIALDAEITEITEAIPVENRKLVTNHDSMGYFADRYDFEVLGAVIPSPSTMAAATPAELTELAEKIETAGVAAIFSETQHSVDDAAALAAEVGDVEVVSLYTGSLGEPNSDAATYVGMLRSNAAAIADALS